MLKTTKETLGKNDCMYQFRDGCNVEVLTQVYYGKEVWIDSPEAFHAGIIMQIKPNGHVVILDCELKQAVEREKFYA